MPLFPLPLTACEEFFFRDDYPAYPNTIAARFRLRGLWNRHAAERAEWLVRARHPLVSCRVVPVDVRERRWAWEPGESIESQRHGTWARQSVADYPPLPGIDLRQHPAGRIAYVVDDEPKESSRTDVIVQGHHAFCDGVAGLQLLVDFLLAYDRAVRDPDAEIQLPPLEDALLRHRGDVGLGTWKYWRQAHRQAIGLFGVHEFLTHQARPLVPAELAPLDQPPPENYPCAVTRGVDAAVLRRLRQRARRQGVTVNELMLAALLQTLEAWREARGWSRPHDWLRITVPMNMRTSRHRRMSAANRVSFISVDRQPAACRSRDLAKSIRGQMDVIRQNQLGLTFLTLLQVTRALPGGLQRLADPQRCGATAILTNLGEPLKRTPLASQGGKLRAGNLVLEGLDLLGPLRPGTNLALAAFRYAGRQYWTGNYDPRVLSAEDVETLLQEFIDTLVGKARD